jgi:ABC-type lipoprotein release transport system permease subunit
VSLIPDLKPGICAWLTMGAALVVVLGLMAAFVPAQRAARIQPMEALRHD